MEHLADPGGVAAAMRGCDPSGIKRILRCPASPGALRDPGLMAMNPPGSNQPRWFPVCFHRPRHASTILPRREQLLHQALLVRLEGRELVGFGADPGVEGGEAVGDSLLLARFWTFQRDASEIIVVQAQPVFGESS